MTSTHEPRPIESPRGARGADGVVLVLVVVGFFLGPLKLMGESWLAYLLPDVLAAVAIVLYLGERIVAGRQLFAPSPLTMPLLLLATYCVIQLLNPESPFVRSVLGLRSWLLYLGLYFVGLYSCRSTRQLERLYGLLIALGVVTAAYGVVQWRTGPQAFATWSEYYGQYARLAWSAESGRVFRAFSTFVSPGAFGTNMALIMLLAFVVAAARTTPLRWRLLVTAAFALMGVGIGVSGSRGPAAYLLIAGGLLLVIAPGARARIAATTKAAALAALALGVAVSQVGLVATERFGTIFEPESFFWKWFWPLSRGVHLALEHPLGMGMGYTAGVPQFVSDPLFRELPTTNIDSGYGSAAAELGMPGLLLFGFFALRVGMEGVRVWRALPPGRQKDLLLGPALWAAAYPIVSVIAQPQASLPSSIYFWLLVGMLMQAAALPREGHADRVLPAPLPARQ
jgi:hypothetical protein